MLDKNRDVVPLVKFEYSEISMTVSLYVNKNIVISTRMGTFHILRNLICQDLSSPFKENPK